MTDVTDEPQEPNLFNQPPGVDWFLAFLIGMAEKGIEMGLAIMLDGQTITGTVIGGRKYMDELAAGIKTATFTGDGDPNVWRETIANAFEEFKKIYPEAATFDDSLEARRSFLHLKDVRILNGNQEPIRAGNWRIQLAKVSGVSLGSISFMR